METFYLIIVILLFILALFDLSVGVSNDAVNFLNSAIGSKVAPFKVIVIVAAIGIFAGASMSNGMMDIARHGIFQPQHFYFSEIMLILLAVMMTDVVLLDMFNTLGMPTSTTVSLIFELVGATVAISWVKIANSDGMLNFGELVNTQKAFTVIIAIFVSVAIAFFFGAVVQYLTRLLFSFNYKRTSKYFIGLFGGLCITAIIYFVLIKGLKNASFMTDEFNVMVKDNLTFILWGCFIAFSLLMQSLYWLKVNVLKIIVLLGTFSLALAFASNDLVNFIGVPLTGYSAFMDYSAHATAGTFDTYLMSSLAKSASTEWYFLVIAGIVMVIALATSKKAQGVVKTSVDLARQKEGEEVFGTSPVARFLVRNATQMANFTIHITPSPLKKWINSRFNTDEMILEDKAAFDLVRASVNLVLAGLLIVIGTSMKLPLSTTYVTFMVAMGTSLADRAWGRESVVFRITGVLAVIGGWFITAGAAFTICFIVALLFYFLGIPAMIAMIAIVTFTLIRSNIMYKKRKSEELERDSAKEIA
ncbi:MAG: inorganic phosphate transporter, partial [Massilibacteroides sp.]|nr:inorganic phosphate transporter [Massilibacteroides sp.]